MIDSRLRFDRLSPHVETRPCPSLLEPIASVLSFDCCCWPLAGCGRSGDGSRRRRPPSAVDGASPPQRVEARARPPKPASDPQHPVVLIETSLGNITVQLDAGEAPLTVDNFLSYVNAGHYDQTIVHQVYKGQGFLAGGYGTNLVEKRSGTPIRNEADNGVKNLRGTHRHGAVARRHRQRHLPVLHQRRRQPGPGPQGRNPRDTATACSARSSKGWTLSTESPRRRSTTRRKSSVRPSRRSSSSRSASARVVSPATGTLLGVCHWLRQCRASGIFSTKTLAEPAAPNPNIKH